MTCDFVCREEKVEIQVERAVKKYMPFSEGARNCVGMTLAKINMPAVLATLFSNFSFRLAPEVGLPICQES